MDFTGIAALLTALSLVLGSQGFVAWVQRRQHRSDIGETGDSTLVEMVEQLNVRISNLENAGGDDPGRRTTTWYTQRSDTQPDDPQ